MAYITKQGLEWALKELRDWRESLSNKRVEVVANGFLLLKHLGATTSSAVQISEVLDQLAGRFLKVSYASDPTIETTKGAEYLFLPLGASYVASTKPESTTRYASGTLKTQLKRQYNDNNKLVLFDDGPPVQIRMAPKYLEFLKRRIKPPIPAAALSIFLFRRPSDCGVDGLVDVDTLADLVAKFFTEFNISDAERSLFNETIPNLDFPALQ